MDDPDLFRTAEDVASVIAMPGWKFIADSIAEHERKMTDQLLSPGTKGEALVRLQGEILGLRAMQAAAQSILDYATERESKANAKQESLA